MQHDIRADRAMLRVAHEAQAFEQWLREDGERLMDAAELLGGDGWRARSIAVVSELGGGASLGDLADELSALRGLLMLERVDDLDSEEAALFLQVHPDDPRADDARLCAETLERGLDALEAVATAQIREAA